jgi:hypothetical protein
MQKGREDGVGEEGGGRRQNNGTVNSTFFSGKTENEINAEQQQQQKAIAILNTLESEAFGARSSGVKNVPNTLDAPEKAVCSTEGDKMKIENPALPSPRPQSRYDDKTRGKKKKKQRKQSFGGKKQSCQSEGPKPLIVHQAFGTTSTRSQ